LDICVVKLNTATYQVIIARNNSEILWTDFLKKRRTNTSSLSKRN
jgi:hypothetical protein